MNKAYLILLVFSAFFTSLQGQNNVPPVRKMPSIGRLYGKVLDARTKIPAGYSTVILLAMKSDSSVSGCLVKENGDFSLENLPFGQFRLRVGFAGYKKFEQTVSISMQSLEKDLGNILLEQDVLHLKEVEITGEKSTLQMNIDHKVYNVSKDISTRGGTGLDAVKNIPGITVDADGNVSLRNTSTQVYIDGRPTTLSLQQISAEQIDHIEVITNPSAKYDAATTGGLLNVVLKKNSKPGYNGAFMGAIGTGKRNNIMGNLNVKEGKFNFFSMYSYNTQTNDNDGFSNRVFLQGTPFDPLAGKFISGFNQTNINQLKNTFNMGRLGFDYAVDNRNTITLSGTLVHGSFDTNDDQQYYYTATDGNVLSTGNRLNTRATQFTNYSTQLQYKRTYPRPGKEFTTDLNLNNNNINTGYFYTTKLYDLNQHLYPNSPSYQKNTGQSPANLYTYQADFVNPFNDSSKFEAGVKSYMSKSVSETNTSNYDYKTDSYIPFSDLTNNYHILNTINAGYLTYSSRYKGIGYQGGLRFEQSFYKGTITDKNIYFSYSYPEGVSTLQYSLFPAVYFSKKLPKQQELQLNFSRKINRPNFFQLMPYVLYADNANITIGNPALRPEFHNLSELNYSVVKGKINFLFSLYSRYIQNPITNISYPEAGNPTVLVSSFQNGDANISYGTDNTLKFNVFKILDITASANVFHTYITWSNQKEQISNAGYSSTEKLGLSFKFPASFTLQLNGSYQAPQIIPQGTTRAIQYLDITFSKTIYRFMTATILLSDAFNSKRMGTDFNTPDYIQTLSRRRETRYIKFSLSFVFGKMDASIFKRLKQKQGNTGTQDGMDF
jgi:iron complex outermembrane receptor protein